MAILILSLSPVAFTPNTKADTPDTLPVVSSPISFSLEDVANSGLGNVSKQAQQILDQRKADAEAKAQADALAAQEAAQQAEQARLTQVAADAAKASQVQPAASSSYSPGDNEAMNFIFLHESTNNPTATNSEGCLGLGQACPASKLINACPDYATNVQCQIDFFTGYANSRYGGWGGAYQFWVNNHWW